MDAKTQVESSALYEQILVHHKGQYQHIIALCEMFAYKIATLPNQARIQVSFKYVEAIYQQGQYAKVLTEIDPLIEDIICHNVCGREGEDLYCPAVFIKAASYYNLRKLQDSERIAKQLLKIHPNDQVYRWLLNQINVNKHKNILQRTRAIAVMFFLLSAGLIAVELFVIIPFIPEKSEIMMMVRNSVFLVGIALMVIPEVIIRIVAYIRVKEYCKHLF